MAADQAGGMAVSGVPPGYAVPPIGGTILPGGTAPPMGGTVSCCLSAAWHDACFCRHDVMPSIDGTVSRRRIRRRKSGAGRLPGTASGEGLCRPAYWPGGFTAGQAMAWPGHAPPPGIPGGGTARCRAIARHGPPAIAGGVSRGGGVRLRREPRGDAKASQYRDAKASWCQDA